jgi:type IV pilus assembly protein PilC
MPVYVFRGRHARSNSEISGERFSNSAAALAAVLRKEQIVPITIREKRFTKLSLFLRKQVHHVELAVFTRQFSVMLDAGLPLIQGLRTIAQQHTNKAFKMVLDQIINEVESGTALSAAMANHPKVFDSLYTNMVAAGESGGVLDTILQRLSIFIEKIVKLKRALRSALIYPTTVLTIATAVVAVILWKVVPVFGTLFAEFDADLPLPTRFVIALSRFVETHISLLIIFVVLCILGIRSCYATETGRRTIDRLLHHRGNPPQGHDRTFHANPGDSLGERRSYFGGIEYHGENRRKFYPRRFHLYAAPADRRGDKYGRSDAPIRLFPSIGYADGICRRSHRRN